MYFDILKKKNMVSLFRTFRNVNNAVYSPSGWSLLPSHSCKLPWNDSPFCTKHPKEMIYVTFPICFFFFHMTSFLITKSFTCPWFLKIPEFPINKIIYNYLPSILNINSEIVMIEIIIYPPFSRLIYPT